MIFWSPCAVLTAPIKAKLLVLIDSYGTSLFHTAVFRLDWSSRWSNDSAHSTNGLPPRRSPPALDSCWIRISMDNRNSSYRLTESNNVFQTAYSVPHNFACLSSENLRVHLNLPSHEPEHEKQAGNRFPPVNCGNRFNTNHNPIRVPATSKCMQNHCTGMVLRDFPSGSAVGTNTPKRLASQTDIISNSVFCGFQNNPVLTIRLRIWSSL